MKSAALSNRSSDIMLRPTIPHRSVADQCWRSVHIFISPVLTPGRRRSSDPSARVLKHLRTSRADTIKIGDRITMNVMLALDGSHHAATASVVLADGGTVRVCTVTYNDCP
jgi:hypothetical protein